MVKRQIQELAVQQLEEQKYLTLDYTYWGIDKNNVETYPTRSITEAFEDLKNGSGNVLVKPRKNGDVSISNIYLAYLLQKEYSSYIQPFFVFSGDDFAGIVPAIEAKHITK